MTSSNVRMTRATHRRWLSPSCMCDRLARRDHAHHFGMRVRAEPWVQRRPANHHVACRSILHAHRSQCEWLSRQEQLGNVVVEHRRFYLVARNSDDRTGGRHRNVNGLHHPKCHQRGACDRPRYRRGDHGAVEYCARRSRPVPLRGWRPSRVCAEAFWDYSITSHCCCQLLRG